jgi:hypothetical protein
MWQFEWIMMLTMAVFVFQIGLMGFVCAHWIDWPILRWLLYGWCWLLIDIQTLIATVFANQGWWWQDSFHAASLFAAQLGLVTIWAVLGTTRWAIRWPVALVLASALLLPSIHFQYYGVSMMLLFASQLLVLFGICGVMRWQRFRLTISESAAGSTSREPPAGELQGTQFGVRDVLIWMTALGLICGLSRAVGLPLEQWDLGDLSHWLVLVSSGTGVGMALVIALWGALGTGRSRHRWLVVLLLIPTIGIGVGVCDWLPWVLRARRGWASQRPWWEWVWESFFYSERRLIIWICLAGATLFATLLFLRSLGYRLAREDRRPDPIMQDRG